MSRGRPGGERSSRRRPRRARGWLSGSKGSSTRRPMPLWQWLIAIPLLLIIVAGIVAFAYVSLINPKVGAGVRNVTVSVLERVETRAADGTLDTSASYLVVKVDATPIRLAPRLPDWNEVAKGDLVTVEVGGTGNAVQAFSWKRAAPPPH